MTRRLNRNDSHVIARAAYLADLAAREFAAHARAANEPYSFEIKTSDSYASIWESTHDAARVVGTITRPRLFPREPFWIVSDRTGRPVLKTILRPSRVAATNALIRAAAKESAE